MAMKSSYTTPWDTIADLVILGNEGSNNRVAAFAR
jgi:hypothetical protein